MDFNWQELGGDVKENGGTGIEEGGRRECRTKWEQVGGLGKKGRKNGRNVFLGLKLFLIR